MPKEILLYGAIASYSVETFINKMEEAKGQSIKVRVNTPGGQSAFGYGAIAKFQEHTGKKGVIVDGDASSMGLMFVLLADSNDRKAVNTARFVVHRPSYGEYYEKSEYFPQVLKDDLAASCKDMEALFRKGIDVNKFEALKKVSVAEIFATDKRLEVRLSAKEAKDIGLINEIVDLTVDLKANIEANLLACAEEETGLLLAARAEDEKPKNQNTEAMTIEKLKAEFPLVFAAAIAMGVEKEKDRVGSWMAWMEIDPKKVKEGIEKGGEITAKISQELQVSALKGDALKKLAADSAEDVNTKGNPDGQKDAEAGKGGDATAKQSKAAIDFEKELDGLNPKKAA